MKNRQFITLLLVVIAGFIYIGYRIDNTEKIVKNIDQNVVNVDERIVWKLLPKVEYIYDNY